MPRTPIVKRAYELANEATPRPAGAIAKALKKEGYENVDYYLAPGSLRKALDEIYRSQMLAQEFPAAPPFRR